MVNRIFKIAILFVVSYSFFLAIATPHIADAKFYVSLAETIKAQRTLFTDQSGTHPLLVPLCFALFGKLAFPIMYAELLFVFYWNLRKHISETSALFWTFILTGFPLILYHSTQVYCDMPMALFYTGGMIYFYEYFCDRKIGNLIVSAVFLGLGVHVKASGLPLWITASGVLILFLILENRKIKDGLIFFFTSGLIALPWLLSKGSLISHPAKLGEKIGSAQPIVASHLGEVSLTTWNVIKWISMRLFLYADWHILWFVFISIINATKYKVAGTKCITNR